ncbi:MAG: GTPase Era [Caulobacterales bacterium]
MTATSKQSAVIAAIIGAPNAGKSTLVNKIVGQKVAIVTPKVQTTRFPLRGVAMRGAVQIVLIDTPGVFAPRRRLDRAMVRAAWTSADDADALVHLVDAAAAARLSAGQASGADHKAGDDVEAIIASLKANKRSDALLALNKVDAMPREALLALTQRFHGEGCYGEIFMISAQTGSGLEDLVAALAKAAKPGPWLYPEDQAADAPARLIAAEVTREKLMLRLHDEIPYDAAVETTDWQERRDGSVRIEQTIFVARDGQRKIAIGEGGRAIKMIGEQARKELEGAFERKVHLFLHVKVREGWADERANYAAWGLDYES